MPGRTGYRLAGIHDGQSIDWPGLITGSEGTLAIVTEATLSTDPLPEHVGVAMLMFAQLEQAARAATQLLPLGPTACDLLDRRHISLARDTDPRYELLIPEATEAILLVEHEAGDADELKARLLQTVDRAQHEHHLAFASRLATTPDDIGLFWNLARHVVRTLHRLRGSVRPVPIVEDVTVPPARLPEFLGLLQEVLKRRQVTASLFGHVGHGQLHIRPFVDLARPETAALLSQLAVELYGAVKDAGGTIGAEHGLGLSRSEFTASFYPDVEPTLRQIKSVLDPHNILNPGKVVDGTTNVVERNIRRFRPAVDSEKDGSVAGSSAAAGPRQLVELQLAWSAADAQKAMSDCNGCGHCRTRAVETRMCPIFRFAPAEEASPRAKANLLRGLLTGDLSGEMLASDEFKAVVDTCVHCHMCRLECPASVDIPKLMVEARGAQVSARGLDLTDWFFCRIDRVARWSSRLSPLANFAVGNPTARWLMEKLFGIAARRKLPHFARRSFVREAAERGLDRPTLDDVPKVMLFVDTFANYSDTQLAAATVEVLDHNGVSVYVPAWQRDSGMALFSSGALDEARALVEHQLPLLAEAVRQGYHIVSAEPSAALCLRREYPAMVDDEDARLVADNTSDVCSYLWRWHRAGNLRLDFSPLKSTVTYHTPCHSKALENGDAARHLLDLVPGLRVIAGEWGCSGMAGTFGMKRKNFRDSIRAGWKLVEVTRQSRYELGATECSACKLQMEQGTTRPTIHPIKLIALSYGLMPEIASQLVDTDSELIVS
jgi:Fe-S oxidoreductase